MTLERQYLKETHQPSFSSLMPTLFFPVFHPWPCPFLHHDLLISVHYSPVSFLPHYHCPALYESMPGLKSRKFCCFLVIYPAKPMGIISRKCHFLPGASDSASVEVAYEVESTFLSLIFKLILDPASLSWLNPELETPWILLHSNTHSHSQIVLIRSSPH